MVRIAAASSWRFRSGRLPAQLRPELFRVEIRAAQSGWMTTPAELERLGLVAPLKGQRFEFVVGQFKKDRNLPEVRQALSQLAQISKDRPVLIPTKLVDNKSGKRITVISLSG